VTRNARDFFQEAFSGRLTVEKLARDTIDARELKRIFRGREGWVRDPWQHWPTVAKMFVSRYLIRVELRNQTAPQSIQISWTRCHFGGSRPWLVCPHCQRRMARLFKGFAGYFCRSCVGNPPYESKRRSTKARIYLRVYRLRMKLDGSRPVLDDIPPKPYRMQKSTYLRLRAEIEGLESQIRRSRVIKERPEWIPPLYYE